MKSHLVEMPLQIPLSLLLLLLLLLLLFLLLLLLLFSSDRSSINMSVASLLQMRIVPLFFGFSEAIFLPAKSTRFSAPELWFSWTVMSAKNVPGLY